LVKGRGKTIMGFQRAGDRVFGFAVAVVVVI
jgi:hypothetical protein